MGQVASYDMNRFNHELSLMIQKHATINNANQRLKHYCKALMNRTYLRWCVGDGPHGLYNQKPMYRTDYFDCVTWVNTLLALLHAQDIHEFIALYLNQQYRGPCCFLNRNYFMESHWIKANIQDQRIHELSNQLSQKWRLPIQHASTIIDIPAWLKHHKAEDIHLLQPNATNIQQRLLRLHAYAKLTRPINNNLSYFYIDHLLQLTPKDFINLPPIIAMVVRPNWDVRNLIGTHLNISHLGICLTKKNQTIAFYHASSEHKQVVEVNFFDYLEFCKNKIPSVQGFHFIGINT